jgi:hypothetical protein
MRGGQDAQDPQALLSQPVVPDRPREATSARRWTRGRAPSSSVRPEFHASIMSTCSRVITHQNR